MANRLPLRHRLNIVRQRPRRPRCRRTGDRVRGRLQHPLVNAVRVVGRGRAGWRRAEHAESTFVVQRLVPSQHRQGAAGGIRIRLNIVLPILLFLLSFVQNMEEVDDTVFHPDESRWLNRAHFLTDLRDPFGPTWQDQYLARAQPPLGSYLMGLGLLAQGRDTTTTTVWDFTYGVEWNESVGAMPVEADLNAGRRTNAVIGALVVLVVYFIGRQLTNLAGAALGAAFLALHPLHIWLASQALSDQLLNLLVALAALAIIRLARRPTWGRALTLGVLLGLGGAVKLSPMLLSLPLAAFGVFLLLRSLTPFRGAAPALDRSLGIKLLVLPPVAFTVFVISYPYLWPSPIRNTLNLFELRTQEMAGQARAWPAVAVDSRTDAFGRIGDRLEEQFSTTGRFLSLGAQAVGINWEPSGFDFIPVLAGALLFVTLVMRSGLRSPAGLAALLLASQTGAIVVGLRADFYRYHLPIVLVMSICIALCAGALASALARVDAWRWLSFLPGVSVVPATPDRVQPVPAMAEPRRLPHAAAHREPPVPVPQDLLDRQPAPRPATRPRTLVHGK